MFDFAKRKFVVALLLGVGVAVIVGCASTRVKRNPGPHDRGIRYWRPKPYLLIAPVENSPQVVKLSIEYLPDYSEEYSIHIRTGIGTNKTEITLDNGWNLTKINVDIDSKASEMVKSIADLIGALPKPPGGGGPGQPMTKLTENMMTVKAHRVPLGFYEPVMGVGPEGKRIYGWRYVGFAPFAPCPLESGGSDCTHCTADDLYGLVTIDDAIWFQKMSDLRKPSELQRVPAVVAQPMNPPQVIPPPNVK